MSYLESFIIFFVFFAYYVMVPLLLLKDYYDNGECKNIVDYINSTTTRLTFLGKILVWHFWAVPLTYFYVWYYAGKIYDYLIFKDVKW